MRHGKKFNHLSRQTGHRKLMLANMACSLIEHKRINTTVAKAKALKQFVEPLITKSKDDTTHNRRIVFAYLRSKYAVTDLFRDVAAKVLIHHFMLFSDERITLEADEIAQTESYDEESLHMRQLLKTKLVDMDLSVRALNCLKAAEVDTLGDLVSFNKNDLMKFRNFGKKSLTELDELVAVKNLTFGMDLAKYKLDKE